FARAVRPGSARGASARQSAAHHRHSHHRRRRVAAAAGAARHRRACARGDALAGRLSRYDSAIVIELIVTAVFGVSGPPLPGPVGVVAILSSTSRPSVTWPKML